MHAAQTRQHAPIRIAPKVEGVEGHLISNPTASSTAHVAARIANAFVQRVSATLVVATMMQDARAVSISSASTLDEST